MVINNRNGAPNEDVYGTANGQALGNMSNKNNEMIFRLPRPLNYGDVFEIKGELKSNPERLRITLSPNMDHNNIACEIDARFLEQDDSVRTRTILNGKEDEKDTQTPASDIFLTAQFSVTFKVQYINDLSMLSIEVDASYLTTITLKHGLQDIAFLSFSDDILRVNELNFKFNN